MFFFNFFYFFSLTTTVSINSLFLEIAFTFKLVSWDINTKLKWFVAISFFITWGILVYIFRQICFFDKIKDDYLKIIDTKDDFIEFYKKIREKAVKKLKNLDFSGELKGFENNDYILYLILLNFVKNNNFIKKYHNEIDYRAFLGINLIFTIPFVYIAHIVQFFIYFRELFYSFFFLFIIIFLLISFLILKIHKFFRKDITFRFISRNTKLYIHFLTK